MITELCNPKTAEYLQLKSLIFSPTFEWHNVGITGDFGDQKDFNLFVHTFLGRPLIEHPYPKELSQYAELASKVVTQILLGNNIFPHVIYRIAANYVTESQGTSPKHIDHEMPHKNLIVYLNKFTGGKTLVYDKEKKEYASNPKEDLPIIFDGELLHCHQASNEGKRLAIIATYLS